MSELKRVQVWSGALRAAHWAMAAAVIVLLVTGWLVGRGDETDEALRTMARDLHGPAGQILGVALVLRLGLLLFGRAADSWRDLIPRRSQIEGIRAMLRFYLSGARAPLPGYYGHNPLWAPIYLAALALLCLQTLAGIWLELGAVRGWLELPYAGVLDLHRNLSSLALVFTLAHIPAVALHDWRGGRWEVSAMLNGKKIFEIQRPTPGPTVGGVSVRGVRLDEVRHGSPPQDGR